MSDEYDHAGGAADLSFSALFDGPILDFESPGDSAIPVLGRADETVATEQIRAGQVIETSYAVLD